MGECEGSNVVILNTHRERWVEATEHEMKSLYENGTYELDKLLKGNKSLTKKSIFILKQGQHTFVPRCKSGLVLKGLYQINGIELSEIFSPLL